jgi:homoserine dehydrogenase
VCTVLTGGGAIHLGPVTVLKFGSSLLCGNEGFEHAVDEISRELARGHRVVAVVSAMKGTTDRLLSDARGLSRKPAQRLLSVLLRTGEDASVALLGIALVQVDLNAHVLTAEELRLRTTGPLHDADPDGVDLDRLVSCLRAHDVIVVPGFAGTDREGHPSLLGRGGSDLTALYLGERLGAEEVRLVKDVDGVYPHDPNAGGVPCEPLESTTWREVERIGNGVVQPKALHFAERCGLSFRVAAVAGAGTWVGPAVRTGVEV